MACVNALVLTGYGTNSHNETAHAIRQAGANSTDIVHFSDIIAGNVKLENYQFLLFPGGFLDGDDLGSAQAAAQRWLHLTDENKKPLLEHLNNFLEAGKLVMGICNGFQLLVKLGVLPAFDGKRFERQVSLTHNLSARYEDRWVTLKANPKTPCIFTKDIDLISSPVRHGEGRIVTPDEATLKRLEDDNLICLQYADPKNGTPTQEYPLNPNGSPKAIAGLTDPTGHVLGLMPHPEAYNHPTNHPNWANCLHGNSIASGDEGKSCEKSTKLLGTAIFENAINFLK